MIYAININLEYKMIKLINLLYELKFINLYKKLLYEIISNEVIFNI